MKPVHWIVIAVLISALVIYWFTIKPEPEEGTVEVPCGEGKAYRYKNPDKVFPEFIRSYESGFKVTSGVLNKLVNDSNSGGLSLDVKNTAESLISTLDQQNIFYQTTLKAYFVESNNNPCDTSLRNRYLHFIEQMSADMMDMRMFITQVTISSSEAAAKTDTTKVLAVVDTAKAKVDTTIKTTGQVQTDQLVVVKNPPKLNTAVNTLATKFKPRSTQLQNPRIKTQ